LVIYYVLLQLLVEHQVLELKEVPHQLILVGGVVHVRGCHIAHGIAHGIALVRVKYLDQQLLVI
jgi:hypothetical protein